MIFFAIFIVNSFLNSGLGYVSTSGGVSNGLNSGIGCAINLSGSSLWSSWLSLLFLWGVTLVSLCEWNCIWVREWLWINEISGISFNLDLGRSSGVSGSILFNFNLSFGLNLNLSLSSGVNSSVSSGGIIRAFSSSVSLNSGVGGFDC